MAIMVASSSRCQIIKSNKNSHKTKIVLSRRSKYDAPISIVITLEKFGCLG